MPAWDLSGEGLTHRAQTAGADSWPPLGSTKEPARGFRQQQGPAGRTMAQGTVIHVAPEQPTSAVCVLGTEAQLDVCG